jgi:transposase
MEKAVKQKKYSYFIGIDISKNELDYAVMHRKILLFHQEYRNETVDILAFVNKLNTIPGFKLSKAIFCMENTGIYGNVLLQELKKLKANIAVEHPLHIKHSMGLVREKSDKSDAIQIAAYAQKNTDQLKLWAVKRPAVLLLAHLVTLRNRLLGTSMALMTPIKEQELFIQEASQAELCKLCHRSIAAIKADLAAVERRIKGLIRGDERLKGLYVLILSVPGIGFVTAVQILLSTNEFHDIRDPRKFASYAGVAPFKRESGKKIRRARISVAGSRKMKTLLHISALAAIRSDDEIKAYYERKTKTDGKPKLVAINAVRSKLILRVFACVNKNRPFTRFDSNDEKTVAGEAANYESSEA